MVWLIWAIMAVVGLAFLVLVLVVKVITYKPPVPSRSGRAKIFNEALEALRAGKQYHMRNLELFDGSSEKIRFFAEALGGQLQHPVYFDELSYGTSGEVVFSTGAEVEDE